MPETPKADGLPPLEDVLLELRRWRPSAVDCIAEDYNGNLLGVRDVALLARRYDAAHAATLAELERCRAALRNVMPLVERQFCMEQYERSAKDPALDSIEAAVIAARAALEGDRQE